MVPVRSPTREVRALGAMRSDAPHRIIPAPPLGDVLDPRVGGHDPVSLRPGQPDGLRFWPGNGLVVWGRLRATAAEDNSGNTPSDTPALVSQVLNARSAVTGVARPARGRRMAPCSTPVGTCTTFTAFWRCRGPIRRSDPTTTQTRILAPPSTPSPTPQAKTSCQGAELARKWTEPPLHNGGVCK